MRVGRGLAGVGDILGSEFAELVQPVDDDGDLALDSQVLQTKLSLMEVFLFPINDITVPVP